MNILTVLLTVIYVIIGVFIAIVVLMQEGNQQGLGSIGGMAESYWGKNKGRSMEGLLVKITRVMAILFIVLAVVLNINKF